MTQVIINDVTPREQFTSSAAQTVFNTLFTADATTDIDVYARASGVDPDDVTQLVNTADYTVTFIGATATTRVTFAVGRTAGDIITIARNTPSDRENLYINTNFTPSMLNQDFGLLTLIDQQNQMYDAVLAPHYNVSAIIEPVVDNILPVLGENQIWAKNNADTAIIVYDVPASGGVAPKTATYLIKTTAGSELPNAQIMGDLASGLVVNTNTTGVQLTRLLTGTANQITLTNGSGIVGNPVFALANNLIMPGLEYFKPPSGTTAQRPASPTDGMVRYNTTLQALEVYEGASWHQLAGGIVDSIIGTVNQIIVDATDPQNPILSTPQDIDQNADVQFNSVQFNNTNSVYDANGVLILSLFGVASAVNYIRFENAITGFGPVIQALGADTDIDIRYFAKGEGFHNFASTGNTPVYFRSGTAYQHATIFSFANTAATRTATWQDSNGTVAWLTDIPPASGLTWSTIAGTSQAASVNHGYVSGNAGLTTITLPATAAVGDVVAVEGLGAAGWVLAANTGQTIKIGSATTTSAGSLASVAASDNIYVTCIVANITWRVRTTNSAGLTIA